MSSCDPLAVAIEHALAIFLDELRGESVCRDDVEYCLRRPRQPRGDGLLRLFLTGFLLNISNPKMPIFYLELLSGVLGIRPLTVSDTVELLVIIALIEVIVVGGHVFLGHKAKTALADPNKISILNRGAGALMVGAGVLVASR